MAITIDNSTTYDAGSYTDVHTLSAFDCSGTNSQLAVMIAQRAINTEVSTATANGNTMTQRGRAENTNVCGVAWYDYTIDNASFNVVVNTPSYKLCAIGAIALSGVDQSTPTAGTPATTTGYGSTATTSYTGTSGNMLLVAVNTQGTRTLTASNCTQTINDDHPDANLGSYFAGYVEATGSSQTIGCTLSADDNYAVSIIEVKAVAGATVNSGFFNIM